MELIGGDEGDQFTRDSELVSGFHPRPLSTSGPKVAFPLSSHSTLPCASSPSWTLTGSSPLGPTLQLLSETCLWSCLFARGFWRRGPSCSGPILWRDILSPQPWDSSWGLFPQETQTDAIHRASELLHSALMRQPRKGQGAGQGAGQGQ